MPDSFAEVTSPRHLRDLFAARGLSPHRSRGQNFLVDANVARKIVSAIPGDGKEPLVEVGPGAGALTLLLAHLEAPLLALELDHGLAALLDEMLQSRPCCHVLREDALKFNWDKMGHFFPGLPPAGLVANLPYNISAPFMYKLFRASFPFSYAVLMFQREVARKLVTGPGTAGYGSLSVFCHYYTRGEVLFNVSRNVFWPRPNVDSAVVRLIPRQKRPDPGDEAFFWSLVNFLFRQRRKTLRNNLGAFLAGRRDLLPEVFRSAELDPQARPEQLSVEQFAKLSAIIYNYF